MPEILGRHGLPSQKIILLHFDNRRIMIFRKRVNILRLERETMRRLKKIYCLVFLLSIPCVCQCALYSGYDRFGVCWESKQVSVDPNSSKLMGGWYCDRSGNSITNAGKDRVVCTGHNDSFELSNSSLVQFGKIPGYNDYTSHPAVKSKLFYQIDSYIHDVRKWSQSKNKSQKFLSGTVFFDVSSSVFTTFDFLRQSAEAYYDKFSESLPIDVITLQINFDAGVSSPRDSLEKIIREIRSWMNSDLPSAKKLSGCELWITGIGFYRDFENFGNSVDEMKTIIDWLDSGLTQNNAMDNSLGLARDENRMVQRWAMFPLFDDANAAYCPLVDAMGNKTELGSSYETLISNHAPEPNSIMLMLSAMMVIFHIGRGRKT
jgi:hypothetical protein